MGDKQARKLHPGERVGSGGWVGSDKAGNEVYFPPPKAMMDGKTLRMGRECSCFSVWPQGRPTLYMQAPQANHNHTVMLNKKEIHMLHSVMIMNSLEVVLLLVLKIG